MKKVKNGTMKMRPGLFDWCANSMHHFLLPCEENGMVPHVLNALSFTVLALLGAALVILPAGSRLMQLALLSGDPQVDTHAVADLVNIARTSEGLLPLAFNDTLAESAAAKAFDMLQKQYFAHVAPDGTEPWDFFRDEGYKYTAAGENLALNFVSAEDAHGAFMNSPTHRANILGKLYTEVGVAVVKGVFQGRPSWVIVQHFGKPALASVGVVGFTAPVPTDQVTSVPISQETSTPQENPALSPLPEPSEPETQMPSLAEQKLSVVTAPDMPIGEVITNVVGARAVDHALRDHLVSTIVLRVAGLLVLLMLTISFALGITRGATFSRGLVLRTFVLFLLFGYIGFFGVGTLSLGELSPTSYSTVLVQLTP